MNPISKTCRQIVPTSRGSILHAPGISQVPYNATNQMFLICVAFWIFRLVSSFILEAPYWLSEQSSCGQAGGLGKVPGFYYVSQNKENLPPS